jgi:oxazoline/thiazoline synthase
LSGIENVGRSEDLLPCYAAISFRPDGNFINSGFGCHPNKKVAATAALCELNQSIDSLKEASKLNNPILKEWLLKASINDHPYLLPDQEAGDSRISAPTDGRKPEDYLIAIIQRIHLLGHDIIIQDLSLAELPLKVVRVISPGLCQHRPRFGFARLYSTPVDMNLREQELKEYELNEQPFPY